MGFDPGTIRNLLLLLMRLLFFILGYLLLISVQRSV